MDEHVGFSAAEVDWSDDSDPLVRRATFLSYSPSSWTRSLAATGRALLRTELDERLRDYDTELVETAAYPEVAPWAVERLWRRSLLRYNPWTHAFDPAEASANAVWATWLDRLFFEAAPTFRVLVYTTAPLEFPAPFRPPPLPVDRGPPPPNVRGFPASASRSTPASAPHPSGDNLVVLPPWRSRRPES